MPFQPLKQALRRWRLARAGVREEVEIHRLPLAYEHGGWMVHPDVLGPESIVYSVGVGENIAWDLAMIERFGMTIHAFDPTPRSVSWVVERREDLPAQFVFHALGLGARDGDVLFHPPRRERSYNYSTVDRGASAGSAGKESVAAPVRRLSSLMASLGHARLDVLKMDIEGGEYEVIDDVIQANIPIGQLLIEFHHNFPGIGLNRTAQAVARLRERGYRLFHVSKRGYETAMIHATLLGESVCRDGQS